MLQSPSFTHIKNCLGETLLSFILNQAPEPDMKKKKTHNRIRFEGLNVAHYITVLPLPVELLMFFPLSTKESAAFNCDIMKTQKRNTIAVLSKSCLITHPDDSENYHSFKIM